MKHISCILLVLLLLFTLTWAENADEDEIITFLDEYASASKDDTEVEESYIPQPQYPYTYHGSKVLRSYDSPTLKYTVEPCVIEGTDCYITKVWMEDPGRQIRKGMSEFHKHLAKPIDMAKQVPGAALVINGSGFVSPTYPEIPDNYPGTSEDYWYTALGSLTITNGEVLRSLTSVPYYGLTLEGDGLHMYVGADNEDILVRSPTQTWSFYVECPLISNHASILDRSWPFANNAAIRTVIAKMDMNNYAILTVTSKHGLTLLQVTDFLLENLDPIWAYDLDGGPSSVLMCRNYGKKTLTTVYNTYDTKVIADIMAFTE